MIWMDGKRSAAGVLGEVREGVEGRVAAGRPRPHLAVVLVGHDPASETYVRHKHRDDPPPDEGAPPKEKVDLSGLKFKSKVTDEELERDRGKYDSELWKF